MQHALKRGVLPADANIKKSPHAKMEDAPPIIPTQDGTLIRGHQQRVYTLCYNSNVVH